MSDLIHERRGEKVSEIYLPLDASQASFLDVAAQIKEKQPDFIFSTVVGDGIAKLHRALAATGIDPYLTPVASHMSSEAEVAAMGADLADGLITCSSYFQSVDTAENRRGVQAYRKRFGDQLVTNMCWEAAYFQLHLLAEAMRRCGTDDPTRVARALPGLEFEAPQGRVRVDEHNNHTHLHPRIGRCNRHGQFDIIASAPSRVPPDPFVVSHRAPAWALGRGDASARELLVEGR
jgi:branched-chain amino acid transport system substrate-binding protein